jgi:hypothetical protein
VFELGAPWIAAARVIALGETRGMTPVPLMAPGVGRFHQTPRPLHSAEQFFG